MTCKLSCLTKQYSPLAKYKKPITVTSHDQIITEGIRGRSHYGHKSWSITIEMLQVQWPFLLRWL